MDYLWAALILLGSIIVSIAGALLLVWGISWIMDNCGKIGEMIEKITGGILIAIIVAMLLAAMASIYMDILQQVKGV